MKKLIVYTSIVLLLLIFGGIAYGVKYFNDQWFREYPNYLKFNAPYQPVSFDWVEGNYKDHIEAHDAIIVPVRIPGLSQKFYMQLDTGSPYSFVNVNPYKALMDVNLDLDTVRRNGQLYFEQFQFDLEGNAIIAELMPILHTGAEVDLNDTTKAIRLGTIGTDLMGQKITLIDFKNQQLQFFDKRPEWMDELGAFQSFDFKGRRLMLPAKIQGKALELFYDSGCSAFGLLTSKNRYDQYTNESDREIHYSANSFGASIPVFHKTSSESMEIGNTTLSLRRVSYVDWHDRLQGFFSRFTNIGGWLGNKPFVDEVLILDTIAEEFLVVDAFENIKK